MTLDSGICLTGIVIEAAVMALLVYRRAWRKLPFFFVYCIWAMLSDGAAFAISMISPAGYSIQFYLTESAIDFALQLCVLVELAWSVLLPLRGRLSRKALWVVVGLVIAGGAAIWPFADIAGISLPGKAWHLMVQLQQTVSILRILFFLVLAGCSQLLSLGWRDRELQVATGFGFYSLVSLAVATMNTHQTSGIQFSRLTRFVAASFLLSLIYWVVSFARKEAERREFTPRMQSALLALAGSARITSQAVTDLALGKRGQPDEC
jgi:hypothetical protein